jgi:hypothetical protein
VSDPLRWGSLRQSERLAPTTPTITKEHAKLLASATCALPSASRLIWFRSSARPCEVATAVTHMMAVST